MVELQEHKCLKCGHKWISRIQREPIQCPRCKRTDWNGMVVSGANLMPFPTSTKNKGGVMRIKK